MASRMLVKFQKYWGDPNTMNMNMFMFYLQQHSSTAKDASISHSNTTTASSNVDTPTTESVGEPVMRTMDYLMKQRKNKFQHPDR